MRIGIVNDLAVACEALRRVVISDPALRVAWIAHDGAEAIAHAARDTPDLILMDLIMPRVDGVAATRAIMRASPCPILVVTATVTGNAGLVYEALGEGALDAVNTPSIGAGGSLQGGAELVRRIHLVARATGRGTVVTSTTTTNPASAATIAKSPNTASSAAISAVSSPPSLSASSRSRLPRIIAIGASTGGPRATATVLRGLSKDLDAAIIIVQHVSKDFAAGYAAWLAAEIGREVTIARNGATLHASDIVIAGEERHLAVTRHGTLEYRDEPRDQIHQPAIDELFASLATLEVRGVAVLLTGMGRDGAASLLTLRRAGWHTIAQDEPTSVVWGMPGAAHKLNAAVETLPLDAIASSITVALARASNSPAKP